MERDNDGNGSDTERGGPDVKGLIEERVVLEFALVSDILLCVHVCDNLVQSSQEASLFIKETQ
jgi:hypothetical protein